MTATAGATALAAALLAGAPAAPELAPARLYLEGRRAEALDALTRRPPGALAQELDALRALDVHDAAAGALTRAALMVHAEAVAERRAQLPDGFRCGLRPEDDHARALAALLTSRADSRAFARRFFLHVARSRLRELCLGEVGAWTRSGLKWFPKDAELLLAQGTAAESAAVFGGTMGAWQLQERIFSGPERKNAGRELRRARDAFAQALAAAPSLLEARLRLGRTLWRLGEREAARVQLERVAAADASGVPGLAYLSRLFLARAYDDAGRRADAARLYRAALEADPGGQAAAVGLAQLLGRNGDAIAARDVLAAAVAHSPRGGAREPYWSYPAGLAPWSEAELVALRAEVAP